MSKQVTGCPCDVCGYEGPHPVGAGEDGRVGGTSRAAAGRGDQLMSTDPLETERQARELPAVKAVYAEFAALSGTAVAGGMDAPNLRMLEDACSASGVVTGRFERKQLRRLARDWEPEAVAVFARLIERAYAAGKASR